MQRDVEKESSPRTSANSKERSALATTSSAHFLHDGIADSLYVLLPFWAQSLGLNYTQVGSLKTAYSAAMAILQTPAGLVAERIGERALLGLGTILAGAAFGALALASSYGALFAIILLVGFGSAVQHPLASSLIARAYDAGPRRAALGVYNFSGDMGKMVVAFAVAAAAGAIGWQTSVAVYGLLVVLAGFVLLLLLRRLDLGARVARPNDVPPSSRSSDRGARDLAEGWGLKDAKGYSILSGIHIIDSAGRTACLTLLPFLLLQKGAASASVGLALALVFAGGAAGKLACGLLAARVGILRTVAFTELGTAALLLGIIAAPLPLAMVSMPLLGIGLNGTSSVLYGTVADFARPDRQARAFGLFYTLGSAAGGASPLVFGVLSDGVGVPVALACLAAIVLTTLPLSLLLSPHLRAAAADGG
jgi:FSR family fosmidomycin resistance protein-like MFS transporter